MNMKQITRIVIISSHSIYGMSTSLFIFTLLLFIHSPQAHCLIGPFVRFPVRPYISFWGSCGPLARWSTYLSSLQFLVIWSCFLGAFFVAYGFGGKTFKRTVADDVWRKLCNATKVATVLWHSPTSAPLEPALSHPADPASAPAQKWSGKHHPM